MRKNRKKKTIIKIKWIIAINISLICLAVSIVFVCMFIKEKEVQDKPESLLNAYMNHISNKEYEEMYNMIDLQRSGNISQEDFITRNSKIYEGMEAANMKISDLSIEEGENGRKTIYYETKFNTVAGEVRFENNADFVKDENGYLLVWEDRLIHPDLESGDKLYVKTTQAKRGNVLDRNGTVLGGKGTASSVGVVPGKLKDKKEALEQIADLLEVDVAAIEKKLGAGWVKEDSFVPLKTITKLQENDFIIAEPDNDLLKEKDRQEKLLKISGVMISDVEVREYPLKEAAAHLIGYVQNVTADDLEEHALEGYTANSIIGKSGMEGLYEKELKGQNGCEIYISDEEGKKKTEIASIAKQNGRDIQLTVDAGVQSLLYEQFKNDKSCTVAMNPYTGEILALISTPSFDNNDFIMGMSNEKWASLNENENKPMYNRFRQVWCPGSSFKPVIGAIGLKTGAINPEEDYGNVGLSWQKDSSWGSYFVTTLHTYEPVVLENALIYSDNIYFAKAALKIGAKDLASSLDALGFNQKVPFDITLKESQYSNTDSIESEVQLADSGYGQGQVLINPVHLASIYTSFLNDGNIIKPNLLINSKIKKEIWIKNAFPSDFADQILEGMKKVVNNPHGTGYSAHRKDMQLAGKTGTAEIKASKDDTSGTELGWFAVFTTNPETEKPILIVSMVEDVKKAGGSGYVVKKVKNLLDIYLNAE